MGEPKARTRGYWITVAALTAVVAVVAVYVGGMVLSPFLQSGDWAPLAFVGGIVLTLAVFVGVALVWRRLLRWAAGRRLASFVVALPLLLATPAAVVLALAVGGSVKSTTWVWVTGPQAGQTFSGDEGPLTMALLLVIPLYLAILGVQILRAGFVAPPAPKRAAASEPAPPPAAPVPPAAGDGMIRFGCPKCGKALKSPARGAGRATDCPRCGGAVRVPPAV